MNSKEFDVVEQQRVIMPMPVGVIPFGGLDRTLLWGYDVNRYSWHVFLNDGFVYRAHYGSKVNAYFDIQSRFDEYRDLIPNKRLYPEACDFEFSMFLKGKGVDLPFTVWDDKRVAKQFHGLISLEQFESGVGNPGLA